MALVNCMGSGFSRAARIAVGSAMVGSGLARGGGWLGLSIVGLVPLTAGAFAARPAVPLFGLPLRSARWPGT